MTTIAAAAVVLIAGLGVTACESEPSTYKPGTTKSRSTKAPAKWETSVRVAPAAALPTRA